jgi:hypothetical protein
MIIKTIQAFIKLIIVGSVFIIFFANNTFGQTENSDSIQIQDSVLLADEEYSFLFVDVSYTNNNIKIGDQPDVTIPAIFSDLTYFHKSGFYSDLIYVNYIDADTTSYDIDIQAGFQKYFFKDAFDIDFNYTFHNYTGMEDYKGLDYNHVLNLSLGSKYKLIHIYADGIFYLDNKNYFTDFGLDLLLDFSDIIFKNDYIFIQPTLSVSYGTDYWLYDIYGPYIESTLLPILRFRCYPVNNLSSKDIIERYLQNNGLSTNTYSYQGVDFLVPITIGINSISTTFAWMYNIPSDKVKAFGLKDQSGYIISLSYIF